MKNPKISVIMSVYNGMPYLKEAVKSILNQTYKNFEFIIVEDGSTDGSWKYLKSLKDRRIKLIKNSKNLGLAASLNKALGLAQGDYVARMDADDLSLPKRLEEQVKFFKNHPSIDICGTWADIIDQNGNVIGEKKYPTNSNDIRKALSFYNPIIHPSLMIRKMVFDELKGYDANFDYAEDYDLLMRARKKFSMANLPKKLIKWRIWDERRSRAYMTKVDKIDLKIKLSSLARDGVSFYLILGIIKKLLMMYLLPFSVKHRITKYFKIA